MKSVDAIQQQINNLVAKLAWLQKHAPLSEIFNTDSALNLFMVFCHSQSDRDTKLTEIGALLGTDGWTATVDRYTASQINWHKEVDGIVVKIYDAQGKPDQPSSWPVPPTAFPLQLPDSQPI